MARPGSRLETQTRSRMRVLILTSSTGGGHNMRAESFRRWFEQEERDDWVVIHKALEGTSPLYAVGVGVYNWIQRTAPLLHHAYFNWLEVVKPCGGKKRLFGRKHYIDFLNTVAPDVIISVHGSLNHGFFQVAREELGERVRLVTYCGELFGGYGFSRNWVNPQADLFIGAVEETCETARRLGMPPEKCLAGGFMLHPGFYEPPLAYSRREEIVCEQLALDPGLPILLLSTGAVGANNHLAFVNALENAGIKLQVAAICGTNETVRQRLIQWRTNARHVRLAVLGYERNMHELMRAVTAIVARPGTGTTSEAVVSGCPIIFNGIGGIMPQERITLKWAEVHGFGHPLTSPSDLVKVAKGIASSPVWAETQRARLEAAKPPLLPDDILRQCRSLIPN